MVQVTLNFLENGLSLSNISNQPLIRFIKHLF
ncbi:Uncharacterised protein [Serratia grimesii]|jgi:hypothetical protein|nr:Uncharacterised protein [Serratia grimesii]CAI1647113.1 Uncharacterised protein [Serratia grimesii]CUW22507.1 Uncharacterised protein [Serratia grimesii]SMZ57657.1 Uncharacterised protein [Serratia grimesii]SUI35721.1 Uncharacterised protein [Serratia grimesii]